MRSKHVKKALLLVMVVALLVMSMSAVALGAASTAPDDAPGPGAPDSSGDGISDGSDFQDPDLYDNWPFGTPNDDPPTPGK